MLDELYHLKISKSQKIFLEKKQTQPLSRKTKKSVLQNAKGGHGKLTMCLRLHPIVNSAKELSTLDKKQYGASFSKKTFGFDFSMLAISFDI